MDYVRGSAVFEGVGGDILNPRPSDDAFDAMLTALHEVTDVHNPGYSRDGSVPIPFYMDDYYKHLEGIVEGAARDSYADMTELTWPGSDWQVNGGKFDTFVVFGSAPHYKLSLDVRKGNGVITDYEQGVLRRIGGRSLLMMNPDMLNCIRESDAYFSGDERHLSIGYAFRPDSKGFDIRDSSGNVTGDSVRRALDPYSEKLASIATNLTVEAQRSKEG